MQYKIRNTKLDEILAVQDAHRRSIREICSKDYSKDQIEKFSDVNYTHDRWKKIHGKDLHLVVEVDGKIEGFCHAVFHDEGYGEIMGLYLSAKVAGKGIGREIIEKAFDYLEQFKPNRIFLNGTKTAKPFYEKMGFKVIREVTTNIRGADITSYEMEKIIER